MNFIEKCITATLNDPSYAVYTAFILILLVLCIISILVDKV